jgi:hypothetical protein
MTTTLTDANDALRTAVRSRMATTQADDPKLIGYRLDQGDPEPSCCEGGRMCGDGILHEQPTDSLPAEKLLLDALAVIRDRRPKYGGPLQHFKRTVGMINAAFAEVLKRPLTEADWAIFMTLDKVARYCGPSKTADGPVDLAGYAACLAEVEAAR